MGNADTQILQHMHSPLLLEHFRNPRNAGELPPPAVTVEVMNPVCGDILRVSVLVENGRIVAARFKARGCTASIGAGSALTELLRGRSREELQAINAAAVEEAVGGLIPESKHAAALCADAAARVAATAFSFAG
jgi:nitrogen fixation NifU-like protein